MVWLLWKLWSAVYNCSRMCFNVALALASAMSPELVEILHCSKLIATDYLINKKFHFGGYTIYLYRRRVKLPPTCVPIVTEMVCCPKCYSPYMRESVFNSTTGNVKTCQSQKYPRHFRASSRGTCGEQLGNVSAQSIMIMDSILHTRCQHALSD